jgi:uncharacterized repeat protein (TIGR01451 family)
MKLSIPTIMNICRSAGLLLLVVVANALSSQTAFAQDCSDYGGVLDGLAGDIAPSQLQIDQNCVIRNFPASNPMDTNFSFFTQPGQNTQRWLVVFDNVVHTGNMSCNSVLEHKLWFVNGASTSIQEGCQNLLIPVEKIEKSNPAGQSNATVGVPFTYTLTMPVLFDPGSRVVIDSQGSLNDLHGVTLTDDLNATGADLSYVSHVAYWLSDGTPVPHTFSNAAGLLTFDNFPIIPAGEQVVIELTVVLDDTPANSNGTQFVNTAKWNFGRLIEGTFYEPLPGEWGISEPMTISGPDVTLTKSGPQFLNLGELGSFTIDVQNIGASDAWNVTVLDQLPNINGANGGGMCDLAPTVTSARVFGADGVTPVPGKGPLVAGSDFDATWGGAPSCELTVTMLTAAAAIGPNERLILTYTAELDADTSNGLGLTNIAAATEWFNADSSVTGRQQYTRSLTNGTTGSLDHEDAHTLTAALFGTYFNKTVINVTAGGSATATPGDILRYSLRLRTTDSPLTDVSFVDDLGAMNAGQVFVPGTLVLDAGTVPAGADASNTDPNGGTNSAGFIDIRNIDLPADSELIVEFEVELVAVLANGSLVTNQAQMTAGGGVSELSDDPNVNGQSSPDIDGDEDPTRIQITSAPALDVDKVSTYLDGDAARLLAGERLRYTITVANVGTDNAVDVELRDQVPANTSYIAGSTTVNGVAVADPSAGVSPLIAGLLLNSAADPTPGLVLADATLALASLATIEFDVRVDPDLIDGTVLSNQAFLDALSAGVADMPSDDPRTTVIDDPTRDIVGAVALLYAEKSAALQTDLGTPGVVDPGDTLRYMITVYNNSSVDATEVVLTDLVPTNTTYVADSTTLNGDALGADGGVSPMIVGLPISSADLTPPLPGAGQGTLTAGETAVIEFDVVVDPGVPAGTLIENQAIITTTEPVPVLTDGDGNPATGPEPTVVIVGPAQQLSITKQIAVVGGGPLLPGSTVEYTVMVTNVSPVPASDVVITDDLDTPVAGQLSFVGGSATMNGSAAGVSIAGSLLTADYGNEYGVLGSGEAVLVRFEAVIDAALTTGTVVTNQADVTWNVPQQSASASVAVEVGGVPGFGELNGSLWHDANFDDVRDPNERPLSGWSVELYRLGQLIEATSTDSDGNYRISGLPPTAGIGDQYSLRFRAPGSGLTTASLGLAASVFTNGQQTINGIPVGSGTNLSDLNLPIDPNGVVYNSVSRGPLAGALLTLINVSTGQPVPSTCFDDQAQQGQVTLADGYYKFDMIFADAACPPNGAYLIEVTAPSVAFIPGTSQIIPPVSGAQTAPLSLPNCLQGGAADAILATNDFCESTVSEFAPLPSAQSGSPETAYYLQLTLTDTNDPGSAQIFNNHIPLDPDLTDAVSVTKTSSSLSVTRGELVPYVITVTNDIGFNLNEVSIIDRFPVGFRYVAGSARVDTVPTEPEVVGQELIWSGLPLLGAGQHRIDLLLAVGAGVSEGDFVNRAQVRHSVTGEVMSNEATATVRLVPDPDFDCTDVMGKVYDDANRNGRQDPGEPGLPGIRLVSTTGLAATTDSYGRYHITCALVPNESRGSNFVMKLDDRTLPAGFRTSLQPIRIERATRGKTLRMNFGASIHRVVGLDLADPIFEPGTTDLRRQWESRIVLLLDQLVASPSVLRLTYLADIEDPKLVDDRLEALESEITLRWTEQAAPYELEIESQVFWRLGGPPDLSGIDTVDER